MSPLWVPAKGALMVARDVGGGGAFDGGVGGVSCTTGASATAKGTPVDLFTNVPFDAYWLRLEVFGLGLSATASEGCMDVLIGPSGGTIDELLIPNILIGYAGSLGTGSGFRMYDFPLYIPAGSALKVQAASVRTAVAFNIRAQLYGGTGGPFWPFFTKVTTVGMGTVPNGTAITPAASGAANSTPTQIIASTAEDYGCVIPGFQVAGDTTINDRHLQVDVMVGAATEEKIGGTFVWATYALEGMGGPWMGWPIFEDIPAGTRLSLAVSNSGANDGGYNGVIHCLN